jgi:hypothetical protein
MGVLQSECKRGRLAWESDDVYVVRHQAKTDDSDAMQVSAFSEQPQVDVSLCIGLENETSSTRALSDMMGNARRDDTR